MGEGQFRQKAFLVGEAPGREEDKRGRPFVGSSGKLLRATLQNNGVSPSSLYITNAVKCFPNGTPKKDEVETCSSAFLQREIEHYDPDYILTLGQVALSVFCPEYKVRELRGRINFTPDWKRVLLATWHPAATLYSRRKLPEFEEDIAMFGRLLQFDREANERLGKN